MTEWLLIFQVALTGQMAVLPMPSEQECRQVVIMVNSGVRMEVTTPNGLKIPIARAVDCRTKAEFEQAMAGGV